jgi:hypothetical protein
MTMPTIAVGWMGSRLGSRSEERALLRAGCDGADDGLVVTLARSEEWALRRNYDPLALRPAVVTLAHP